MRKSIRSLLFFSTAWWFLLVLPIQGSADKIGYIFTGRFYLDGADPLGLHGAHFVLTSTVDAEAEAISFLDEGDYQGTAVYPSESCLTIWGAENPALNATYIPWGPDTLKAAWHHHSFFDRMVLEAEFLLDSGDAQQLVSMPVFYLGLNYDCIYSLPCVPTIDWVYWDPYDLYGPGYSASDVFGRSAALRAYGPTDGIAVLLQSVVDATARMSCQPGSDLLDPMWTDAEHRPNFETVNPSYYAGVTFGSVDLAVTDPNERVISKNLQEAPGSLYLETPFGIEGSPSDFVLLPNPPAGTYGLQVVPEEAAAAEDAFSLIAIDRAEQGVRLNFIADAERIDRAPSFLYQDLIGPFEAVVSVKPGSCPKVLNLKSQGRVTVAILGGVDFDVAQIEPTSVRLNGRRAVEWSLEDLAAFSSVSPGCDQGSEPDGFIDLLLNFETATLEQTLAGAAGEKMIEVVVTGNLKDQYGGWLFRGTDTVNVRPRGPGRSLRSRLLPRISRPVLKSEKP